MSELLDKCRIKKEKLVQEKENLLQEIHFIDKGIELIDELMGNSSSRTIKRTWRKGRRRGKRREGWKTDKSYRKIALEIVNGDPDKWWTTGELTEEAIKRGYFDMHVFSKYHIIAGFSSLVGRKSDVKLTRTMFEYVREFSGYSGKMVHCFKALSQKEEE